jgi:hypothetical protein
MVLKPWIRCRRPPRFLLNLDGLQQRRPGPPLQTEICMSSFVASEFRRDRAIDLVGLFYRAYVDHGEAIDRLLL